jgi:DDE superfamily endonuclease
VWTGPKIARWLAAYHGLKSVHDQRGWDALIAIGCSIQQPRPRHPQAASEVDRSRFKKSFSAPVAAERRKHPDAKIEVWAAEEHRIGLKPITRGVWARAADRAFPSSLQWLYVTGIVEPATGSTVWNVSNNISKAYFELVLADFAKSVGAGMRKRIILQIDNAGWHGPENLAVPDGIRLVFQPAHSPELQPAEHLWAFVEEPLLNRHFDIIEALDQESAIAASRSPNGSR